MQKGTRIRIKESDRDIWELYGLNSKFKGVKGIIVGDEPTIDSDGIWWIVLLDNFGFWNVPESEMEKVKREVVVMEVGTKVRFNKNPKTYVEELSVPAFLRGRAGEVVEEINEREVKVKVENWQVFVVAEKEFLEVMK